MPSGVIKWFSPSKGYGFITRDGDAEDIFLHFSGLAEGQERQLFPGDKVEFSEEDGEKGIKACNVVCTQKATPDE